jgi:hypothetical protein
MFTLIGNKYANTKTNSSLLLFSFCSGDLYQRVELMQAGI